MIGIIDIESAYQRISHLIHHTPVLTSNSLNSITGADLFFKCENFQKAGAFKFRGACNAVFSLNDQEAVRGVCTHSSGNFAQALALAAQIRGVRAFIVMPSNASRVKVEAVKHYGGEIHFCEPTLQAREQAAKQIMNRTQACFIHPYDNYNIIAGQGTASIEALKQIELPDIIMVPVGGGGLLCGTAIAAKQSRKAIRVIAAEPKGADDAFRSFRQKQWLPSVNPKTMADGLLTSLGERNFPIIMQYVDEIVTCSEQAIVDAMKLMWERMKIVVEPSSAVPLACILENKDLFSNKKVCIIVSGGNVDVGKNWFGS